MLDLGSAHRSGPNEVHKSCNKIFFQQKAYVSEPYITEEYLNIV